MLVLDFVGGVSYWESVLMLSACRPFLIFVLFISSLIGLATENVCSLSKNA